jgi:hypothetical protein
VTFIMTAVGVTLGNCIYARFKDHDWDRCIDVSIMQASAIGFAWINLSLYQYFH